MYILNLVVLSSTNISKPFFAESSAGNPPIPINNNDIEISQSSSVDKGYNRMVL